MCVYACACVCAPGVAKIGFVEGRTVNVSFVLVHTSHSQCPVNK